MKKFKNMMIKMKKFFYENNKKWNKFIHSNFDNTQKSLHWLSTIIISILCGLLCCDFGLPKVFGFLIVGFIVFLLINLLFKIINSFAYNILKTRINYIVYTGPIVYILFLLIDRTSYGYLSPFLAWGSAIIIVIVLELFAVSLWALINNKVKTKTIISTLCLTSLLVILGCTFLISDGFRDTYIKEYLQLNQINSISKLSFEQADYQVSSLEYGVNNGAEIESSSFDITPFIGGYEGLKGTYRKIYQGFDFTQVPLSGKVWYPTNQQDCPVLFIVHGNHIFTVPSYLGYDYLGEYLAKRGYVVVSVDQNALNGCAFGNLEEENDARAVLLLENIKQLEKYNKDSSSLLYQKSNFDNIAIAGHSRGGEMVAHTALFNNITYYPENGNITFDYHYNIKSVIAIAPSVDQYKAADHDIKLQDINYLLIQGANDQDVSVFEGSKQYNNVSFSGDGNYFKSSLYIAGANHGQFNTIWGRYDAPSPIKQFLNVKSLMEGEEQRNIMKIYINTFLDVTLKNDDKNKELLSDFQKYDEYLPETVYIQNYQDSTFECIANFDEDSNLKTATFKEASLYASDIKIWNEEIITYNPTDEDNRASYGVRLNWENTTKSTYQLEFAPLKVEMKNLQFDIVDMDSTLVEDKIYKNLDASIMLIDVNGNKTSAVISDYCTVYPPLPVKLGKFQYIFNINGYKHEYQTVRIPFEAFVSDNKEFDYSNVCSIQFLFDQAENGDIMLDNIGFSDKIK